MDNIQNLSCREAIISQDVADFFVQYRGNPEDLTQQDGGICYQIINERYAIVHYFISDPQVVQRYNYLYSTFPKCYGLMDTSNIDSIGVNKIRRQQFLNLTGRGVILGFVDTGIDYRNNVFKNADNTSRIVSIWDQTIQIGNPPEGFLYGTEYDKADIDAALVSEDPLNIVPSVDENGHGTFMAGVAAGNIDDSNDFSGVAPLADIAVVKLKPAKNFLRNYYFINPNAVAYQETDIIMGVKYLLAKSIQLNKPLVLCLGLGTTAGGHEGSGILDSILDIASDTLETCVLVPTGNEANYGGHYRGVIEKGQEYVDVEIRVGAGETGFVAEFWVAAPSLYSIGFISPSGEFIQKIPPRVENNQRITFLFEPTVIYVDYRVVELRTGDELIFVRFENPSEGIWRIRVYPEQNFGNQFDIWLPVREFLSADTQFTRPDPDVTITGPGNSSGPITVAAYDHRNNSIYIDSGRGYTRSGRIKPDLAAPGVNITVPLPNNEFSTRSGTSIAAAHAAGGSALLMEWGVVNGNQPDFDTSDIKALLIKGARRSLNDQYPNRQFGYGSLDVFGALESIRTTI